MKFFDVVLAIASIVNIGLGIFWYEIGYMDGVILAGASFSLCLVGIYIRGLN